MLKRKPHVVVNLLNSSFSCLQSSLYSFIFLVCHILKSFYRSYTGKYKGSYYIKLEWQAICRKDLELMAGREILDYYIIVLHNMLIYLCSFCPYTETTHLLWLVIPTVSICLIIFLLPLFFYCCRKRAGKYVKQIVPLHIHLKLSHLLIVQFTSLFCSSQRCPE